MGILIWDSGNDTAQFVSWESPSVLDGRYYNKINKK